MQPIPVLHWRNVNVEAKNKSQGNPVTGVTK